MASRASFPEVTNVTNYLRENGSGVCLDLQVIDNVPGAKVEEESETHHFLAGNLYKPRRRYQSHYSRHFMTVGGPRASGQRDLPEKYEESHGDVKTTRQTPQPQEGPQPEKAGPLQKK
uniref:sodium/hydrogen exchanger 5-like n=1 Tax=Oncorhynchus gorbuscha TaxID=8017 RepID=UPI001EAEF4D9|nr:sodium/hydrogen exchanger 5-like [Oncorhynchus gorbuscha]